MATETKSKLEDYRHDNEEAKKSWIYGCQMIYGTREFDEDSGTEAGIMLQRIELANEHLMAFISPVSSPKLCDQSTQRPGYRSKHMRPKYTHFTDQG
jgi:hypothetical protein